MPALDITKIEEIKYKESELTQIFGKKSDDEDDKATDKEFFLDFVNRANKDIIFLNTLIDKYNKKKNPENLYAILMQRQKMNDTYFLDMIAKCELYQDSIHKQLFNEIHQASQELGYKSITMLKAGSYSQPDTPPADSSLPEIIANMPHEKIQQLMAILFENTPPLPQAPLYYKNEPGYSAWQDFIKSHSLKVISGEGNSRNLKVEPFDGSGKPFVLKLDMRGGQSKTAENHLRDQNSSHLTNQYGLERQATFSHTINGEIQNITATLIITDFLPKGDLTSNIKQIHALNTADMTDSALDYFQKMAIVMKDMQEKSIAFPDAKMENWLVDDNNELKVADTKSFLIIRKDKQVSPQSSENPCAALIYSEQLNPPEIQIDRTYFSAEAMHVYLLGKNLYRALTNCNVEYLKKKDEFKDIDFSAHSVFQTSKGAILQHLIQEMVNPDAASRISLATVFGYIKTIKELNPVKIKELVDASKVTCKNIIQNIDASQFEIDDLRKKFLEEQTNRIEQTTDLGEIWKIEKALTTLHNQLVEEKKIVASLKKECRHSIQNIAKKYEIDERRKTFLEEQTNKIEKATNPEVLEQIKQELNKCDRELYRNKKIVPILKEQCRNTITEISSSFKINDVRKKSLEEQTNKIERTNNVEELNQILEGLKRLTSQFTREELLETLREACKKVVLDIDAFKFEMEFEDEVSKKILEQQINKIEKTEIPQELRQIERELIVLYSQLKDKNELYTSREACKKILEQIGAEHGNNKLGPDPKVSAFITSQTNKIDHTTSLEDLNKIKQELTALARVNSLVIATIEKFTKSRFLSPSREDINKADKIKQSFLAIPVQDRVHLFSEKNVTKEIIDFRDALSFHRKDKNINTHNANTTNEADKIRTTTTYNEFKKEYTKGITLTSAPNSTSTPEPSFEASKMTPK